MKFLFKFLLRFKLLFKKEKADFFLNVFNCTWNYSVFLWWCPEMGSEIEQWPLLPCSGPGRGV